MNVLVTGATGFLGRHVVTELLKRNMTVSCLCRSEEKARQMPWFDKVTFYYKDIDEVSDSELDKTLLKVDALIHLAWSDLSDFLLLSHLEKHLFSHMKFLKQAVCMGVDNILVAGTCLEYGLRNGPMKESDCCQPITPYALAKLSLKNYLEMLRVEQEFSLKWVRMFYIYGPYQSENSLLPQLERAIKNNEPAFNMSEGDQVRDFLPVESAAKYLVTILENTRYEGVVNCCSGSPISVKAFVQKKIDELQSSIKLNTGFYPYLAYEPLSFWGDSSILNNLIENGPAEK